MILTIILHSLDAFFSRTLNETGIIIYKFIVVHVWLRVTLFNCKSQAHACVHLMYVDVPVYACIYT